jgi:AmmeMemoRadiSam system protein A
MPVSSSPERPVTARSQAEQHLLLDLARSSIHHGLNHGSALRVEINELPPALRAQRASFVTLTRDGELRGCIGTLQPQCALGDDVVNNAWAAAFCDHRFLPLRSVEMDSLAIHISVLSELSAVETNSEEALLSALRRDIDGVVSQQGGRSSTFLPQVWEHFADPRDFLRALRRKAGLPDHYDPRARYSRYQVDEFGD